MAGSIINIFCDIGMAIICLAVLAPFLLLCLFPFLSLFEELLNKIDQFRCERKRYK